MKDFINKMLSGKDDISSKRVMGVIILIVILAVVSSAPYFNLKFEGGTLVLFQTFMYIGSCLLGLGLLDGLKEKLKK